MFEQLNITRDIPMEKVFHKDFFNVIIVSWEAWRHFNHNMTSKVFRVEDEGSSEGSCPPIVAFLANQADKWEVQQHISTSSSWTQILTFIQEAWKGKQAQFCRCSVLQGWTRVQWWSQKTFRWCAVQSCNGASGPVFGDYHKLGLISGLACIMEIVVIFKMGELSWL